MAEPPSPKPPLQIGLRGALALTTLLAVVFAALRWLNLDVRTSGLIAGVIGLALLAAVALVAAIANAR
jgi:hypothetical protein